MTSKYSMKSYMKGALILTIAAVIVKVLSAIYRVPFQNLVGDKGFYAYQQVYPFVAFFVVWTASGFAVAISKMLAEQSSEEVRRTIRQSAFSFLSVSALAFFFVLYFGAPTLANLMGDPMLSDLLKTGAFVTLLMPMLAIFKGTLQSEGEMRPVAVAQVLEQCIRVAIILIGAFVVMHFSGSIYEAGRMAVLGTVVGELCGFLVLYYVLKKNDRQLWVGRLFKMDSVVVKELIVYSVTVSMSSLLLICYQLVDSFTLYSMLIDGGFSADASMIQKGVYDRGQPLVQLGLVLASSLAMAIVPLIAYKQAKQKGSEFPFVQLTYRMTLLISAAAAVGLMLVLPYVNVMLFETNSLPYTLAIYVLQIIPFSLILMLTAVLQGYGKVWLPIGVLLGSILLKWTGNFVFIQLFDSFGAALANVVAAVVAAFSLIIYLRKITGEQLATGRFYWQLLHATGNMVVVLIVLRFTMTIFLSEELSRGASAAFGLVLIAVGGLVFMLSITKYEIVKVRDWFLIPFGRKMAALQLWLHRK